MGFPTKVQLIRRKASEQYYINFSSALAQAIELGKGEVVKWIGVDKANLILARSQVPPNPVEVQKRTPRLCRANVFPFCSTPPPAPPPAPPPPLRPALPASASIS